MSSSWTPCGDAPGSSQMSPRTHHHVQEFGSNIGKIIRGLRKGKRNQSQQLFVPAGPLSPIPAGEHGSTAPERPPPPRSPSANFRLISRDHSNIPLSPAPLQPHFRHISSGREFLDEEWEILGKRARKFQEKGCQQQQKSRSRENSRPSSFHNVRSEQQLPVKQQCLYAAKRSSAPQLRGDSVSECAWIRPLPGMASDMQLLHVNVDEHGETAGSGMDYVTRLSSPAAFDATIYDEQTVKEQAFERLAEIRSVVDEKNRVLGIINSDIEKLQLFMTQRLCEAIDVADCNEEQLTRGINELHNEVADIEAHLAKLRQDSPEYVPPPVPTRPAGVRLAAKWSCLRCTFNNNPGAFRCANCTLPSIRIDPLESEMCGCSVCRNVMMLRLNSVDSDRALLASPMQQD